MVIESNVFKLKVVYNTVFHIATNYFKKSNRIIPVYRSNTMSIQMIIDTCC